MTETVVLWVYLMLPATSLVGFTVVVRSRDSRVKQTGLALGLTGLLGAIIPCLAFSRSEKVGWLANTLLDVSTLVAVTLGPAQLLLLIVLGRRLRRIPAKTPSDGRTPTP